MKLANKTALVVCTGLLGIAVLGLAACSKAPVAPTGRAVAVAPTGPSVDLNAPVKSQAQCDPCHKPLADIKRAGLIYNHKKHQEALDAKNVKSGCDSCHSSPPHRPGYNVVPMASSCYISGCHSVDEDCKVCHDKTYPRPSPNHKPETPSAAQKRPASLIYPKAPVSSSQCVACHPDFDKKFKATKVQFAAGQRLHAGPAGKLKNGHVGAGYRCEGCHARFSHGAGVTYTPDMPTCYQCHGGSHVTASIGVQASVATEECSRCHAKSFQLKPGANAGELNHTARFAGKTHPKAYGAQPQQCAMCHQLSYCVACHQGKPKTRGAAARRKIQPTDHTRDFKLGLHGKVYEKSGLKCAACHDASTCSKCHKMSYPHPVDWRTGHQGQRNVDFANCRICHTDTSSCQLCHHKDLRSATLIKSNCVKCHPTMNTKDPKKMKNRALAEHAVHFGLEKKKSAYQCEKCHVGFNMSLKSPMQVGSPGPDSVTVKGHDTDLCFACHGADDPKNPGKKIAPYGGRALCVRCHKDLKL